MFLHALLLLSIVISTQGYGYLELPTETTNQFGTKLVYCEYQNMKMLPDSTWRTTECEQCECTNSGLFCEGFGFNAGLFGAPEECDVVNDGCDIRLVDAADHTKDCQPFREGPPPGYFGPLHQPFGPPSGLPPPPPPPYGPPSDQFGPPLDQFGPPLDQFGPPLDQFAPPLEHVGGGARRALQ
ncbi:uncharacterized protein LOC124284500 [Haliotis rubra]|uniref:uncharacterized protein LOC124284500 n=1 Tax=Haliotis rubra TaxID=36100 RepID=UPI001EE54707|nr:uncharacterized protein LOC124284500 [Haliotis rubra]XP_046576529.1 uncharacterized protein LOC124284500 [Haliotis rubra]